MKLLTKTHFLGIVILLSICLLSGCMNEDSTISDPVLPEARVELKSPDLWPNPLENLRMDPATLKMLADLRQATVQYHDIEAAMEAGYAQASECVASPDGAMGYHYVNFALVFDGIYDPMQPEALLYEMDKQGNMKLVGVEYIIVRETWQEEEFPHFGSQIFDEAFAPNPLPFDNFQLHVWIWRANPNGIFSKFNPNVKCN